MGERGVVGVFPALAPGVLALLRTAIDVLRAPLAADPPDRATRGDPTAVL
jgi:hypothetical protein